MDNTKLVITFAGMLVILIYTVYRFKENKKKLDNLLKTRMDKIKAMKQLAEEAEERRT